jgi:ABC-type multidrug transport system fused ATPase/permease subunit
LRIISELIVFTAVIIYLFLTQPFVVLSLLCLILIFVSIHNYTLKPKTIQYGKNKIEALNYIYQAVDEGLKGFKEIKILNKENYFKKMQKIGLDKVYENELKSELILFYPRYLYELVIVVFIISFVSYKINIGFVSADIIPLVGTFAVASLRMIPSISVVSSGLIMVQLTYFAIDIIFKDILSLNNNKNSSFNSNNDNFNEKINSIELKNIKFRYPNSSDYIFDNLNLKIKKNTCVGITGENGSGKSTLVDIMLGLLKPESGKILVNGIEHENFKTISKKMGYIPQDHLIISDKISKNISLEYNEKLINLEKLDKAIHSANLKKVISDHSGGANTLIGNDGVRLSGGEYKKIALARMFYHDKDVLIMDEATNSLDKESEEIIIAEMERIKRSKTVIIISHNIKTLSVCDLIFKIDNKKINEK